MSTTAELVLIAVEIAFAVGVLWLMLVQIRLLHDIEKRLADNRNEKVKS